VERRELGTSVRRHLRDASLTHIAAAIDSDIAQPLVKVPLRSEGYKLKYGDIGRRLHPSDDTCSVRLIFLILFWAFVTMEEALSPLADSKFRESGPA